MIDREDLHAIFFTKKNYMPAWILSSRRRHHRRHRPRLLGGRWIHTQSIKMYLVSEHNIDCRDMNNFTYHHHHHH